MHTPTALPRTGFSSLDEVKSLRKRPRGLHGDSLLKDPTNGSWEPSFRTYTLFNDYSSYAAKFRDIDMAYNADSFIRQGVDKYVELCSKHGWKLDSQNPDALAYLTHRFQYMSAMAGKSFNALVREMISDYIKYGNAFWVKLRGVPPEGVPDLPLVGVGGRLKPVLGYFRVDPKRVAPVWAADSRQLLGWEYTPPNGKNMLWPRADVIHFAYNTQVAMIWGNPGLTPVIEDVRGYRQCEEYVMKLLYKHLNPILHHEIPDVTETGLGRQEDVDAAQAAHSINAPDGFIITPPGHKMQMIGAESRAIRGEGYLKLLLERLYAGLGVNSLVMGASDSTSAGSADVMTATMHNHAKFIQIELADIISDHVLSELLIEGGFNPFSPDDRADWCFHEIEIETQIKRENHYQQLYLNNILTETEVRRRVGEKPLTDDEYDDTYVRRVKIPTIQAEAEVRAQNFGGAGDAVDNAAQPNGAARQSAARNNPSNQHGARGAPKIRPR